MRACWCVAMCVALLCGAAGCSQYVAESASAPAPTAESVTAEEPELETDSQPESSAVLQSPEDIALHPIDEYGIYYAFYYGDEEFTAYYEPDCWKVFDSYKITNQEDIRVICQALLNEHEVHGSDFESMRTADDMAYEWQQHNLAYAYAPEDSEWRDSARSVDLDPYDQNKSFQEILADRS